MMGIYSSLRKNIVNDYRVYIYNSLGKIIYQENLIGSANKPLQLQLIETGMYFVKVMNGNEVISTEKIIKL
jgi:hypothetical protein